MDGKLSKDSRPFSTVSTSSHDGTIQVKTEIPPQYRFESAIIPEGASYQVAYHEVYYLVIRSRKDWYIVG